MNEQPTVRLVQQSDYQFAIYFDESLPPIIGDEPAPLGKGTGPAPSQMLAAAVTNCLADSLLFALRKFKQSPEPIEAKGVCEVGRNEKNRLRILGINVDLKLGVRADQIENLDRVVTQFREFCTVSSSVDMAIPVRIRLSDRDDQLIFADA